MAHLSPSILQTNAYFWPALASNKKEVLFMVAYYFESGLGLGIMFSECGCKRV